MPDIVNLFEKHADKTNARGEKVVTPKGMSAIMQRVNKTPYRFITKAIEEATIHEDYVHALNWINYAQKFEDVYFKDEIEKEDFKTILEAIRELILIMKSWGRAG